MLEEEFREAVTEAERLGLVKYAVEARLASCRGDDRQARVAAKHGEAISEQTGVPFNEYIPDTFYGLFWVMDAIEHLNYTEYRRGTNCVKTSSVRQLAPVDQVFWQSSTTECDRLGPRG